MVAWRAEKFQMGYSTEWVVIVFILGITAAVGWQCYLAGHLIFYLVALVSTLSASYLYNRKYG